MSDSTSKRQHDCTLARGSFRQSDAGLSSGGNALTYLLQPDPGALAHVELVDFPTHLPSTQFEALLVDSECEV